MEQYSRVASSTFVLKVNISCRGCETHIEKVLQKIPGVWPDSTVIDAEKGRVTVSGFVDPPTVIRELSNAGKIAELLQIVSQSEVDVKIPRGQVVFVEPVRFLPNNLGQFLNDIERLKEVEVTRDSVKMSFYDESSGGNRKDGGGSRGSGGD
ncbi:unnamed protein product [Ilex paraguariensis]|uniref:HMA domain-containing protein n=1 Tax=Ilex paraguariensis TaxID=185542 RepID=A0ABC8SDH5_9AQUA